MSTAQVPTIAAGVSVPIDNLATTIPCRDGGTFWLYGYHAYDTAARFTLVHDGTAIGAGVEVIFENADWPLMYRHLFPILKADPSDVMRSVLPNRNRVVANQVQLTAAFHAVYDVKDANYDNESIRIKAFAAHRAIAKLMAALGVTVPARQGPNSMRGCTPMKRRRIELIVEHDESLFPDEGALVDLIQRALTEKGYGPIASDAVKLTGITERMPA